MTKRSASASPSPPSKKAAKRDDNGTEDQNPIQTKYYNRAISIQRCQKYNENAIPRPIEVLNSTIKETREAREKIPPGKVVVHWFKRDLRTRDNRGLAAASAKARENGIPLVCIFVVSPEDYEAHFTSPPRVDFELRSLAVLKKDLAEKDIPLLVHTVEKRSNVPAYLLEKCEEWGAKHFYCNIEYEVDELRREEKLIRMLLEKDIDCTPLHDDVVVPPGALSSGAGKQYSVYSPWFRSWVKHIHDHPYLLKESDPPSANPQTARETFSDIFTAALPTAPASHSLTAEEKGRFANLWPAGEHEASSRLDRFLTEKCSSYSTSRNFPSINSTSKLSVHFSSGTLAARTAIRLALTTTGARTLDSGPAGPKSWMSEVAWRDFYKHVLAHWPYICMYTPFKSEYSNIKWEYNTAHFRAWCEGRTGVPIVDAAMRQLNYSGYMHNRCRMIVASFLAKDLLLDWRLGERYFMEHLIDGDFASNNGGWGFAASTGVDPQPYFRIFNPILQSERFDPKGEYIRKWVEELEGIEGKAVHDPWNRGMGERVGKKGYPRPIVDHKAARERALERFKKDLGRETANKGGGVHN
ncbi:putative Deoxyribodipyrimidine photo-lyase [Piedraia hortae CBS 480.64]|uniref:Putative Deoxyribodipyrimidine photo-lyase n=1 Tax=Piedraia hortae CBS 480.64 TaxID=1314780 RepID=A0A6A7C6L2_9PEZI|nr:putative Deoxyribodipyrimidine photo-lyase [Piedraia hortae CBS 480.64]